MVSLRVDYPAGKRGPFRGRFLFAVLDLPWQLDPCSQAPPNTGISCRASSLAPRAVSFIPLFYATLICGV
jgi:hypothetical protein